MADRGVWRGAVKSISAEAANDDDDDDDDDDETGPQTVLTSPRNRSTLISKYFYE